MQKADTVTLYQTLSRPYVLKTRDIMKLWGCSHTTALNYKRKVQRFISETTGKACQIAFITREQLLRFEGWSWEEIRAEALAMMAIQNKWEVTKNNEAHMGK